MTERWGKIRLKIDDYLRIGHIIVFDPVHPNYRSVRTMDKSYKLVSTFMSPIYTRADFVKGRVIYFCFIATNYAP